MWNVEENPSHSNELDCQLWSSQLLLSLHCLFPLADLPGRSCCPDSASIDLAGVCSESQVGAGCSPDCPTLVDIGQQEMEWAVSQPDSLSHGAPRVLANAFRMLLV